MSSPNWHRLRSDIAELNAAALAAAEPAAAVRRALRATAAGLDIAGNPVALERGGRVLLIAAGKAAAGMTRGALAEISHLLGAGVVVTAEPLPRESPELAWPSCLRHFVGAHPLPDTNSLAAGAAVRDLLEGARRVDVVLVLLSGGASSMLEALRPSVTLDQLRRATQALQRAGADVGALNTVRRAVSLLKGGGLARLAAPARVVTLAISDVVGDLPEAIASGPTVPSPTNPRDALRVLRDTGAAAAVPDLAAAMVNWADERSDEQPSGGAYHVVASNLDAATAARAAAERLGFSARVATLRLRGEAREAGRHIGGCAVSMKTRRLPLRAPGCLIFGGETTVTVRGRGRGGRNLELALGAAVALDGVPGTAVFSFATDGVDGSSRAAGALATGDTLTRAAALGRSAAAALAENDTETYFGALGDLWQSGPSGTNVNDLAIALAYPSGGGG